MTALIRKDSRPTGVIVTRATTGKPNAVLYARSSSILESEMCCEAQLARGRDMATRLGFEIVAGFADAATSGRLQLERRPGVTAMKARLAEGDIAALFVDGIEHIGRRAADASTLTKWIECQNTDLYTADRGRLTGTIPNFTEALAAHKSRAIADKIRRGKIAAARYGGGSPPTIAPPASKA